jgi:DNA repair protein RecO (recombination protein O)
MIVKTKAIVLNKVKYSDSGIIVNLYTQNYGRISAIVKGTRARKSNVKSYAFEILNILNIELDYKVNRNLQTLREAVLTKPLYQTHLHPEKAAICFFIAEILGKSLIEQEASPEIFEYISSSINELEEIKVEFYNFHLSFLVHLLSFLGFKPSQNFCNETPYFNIREGMFLPIFTNDNDSFDINQSKLFNELSFINPIDSCKIKINNTARREILCKILEFYRFHIPGFGNIKSLNVLHELFNT